MNVETGRFISQDSYEGKNQDSISLHKYFYTGNDPANKHDPSGKSYLEYGGGKAYAEAPLQTMSTVQRVGFFKALPLAIRSAGGYLAPRAISSGISIAVGVGSPQALQFFREELQKYLVDFLLDQGNSNKKEKTKVLYHYSDKEGAEGIYVSSVINQGPRGTFGIGSYATDIAPYDSNFSRSDLTSKLFGRNTKENYRLTEWFVAFIEQKSSPFTKVAPNIYYSPGDASIYPLTYGQNPMNPGEIP